MSRLNKELQLRKNCILYTYLLKSLNKEVPEYIQECADSEDYDFLVDCGKELAAEVQTLDSKTFDTVFKNESAEAKELSHWWEMYQMYIPLPS